MSTYLDGFQCVFSQGEGGNAEARVMNLSISGAEVEAVVDIKKNEYVDVTLRMPDGSTQAMFGHVIELSADSVRLRWLHFEPGEEQRLQEIFEQHDLPSSHVEVKGTRRIVRPRKNRHSGPLPAQGVATPG